MIDDDDVEAWALFGDIGKGLISFIIFMLILGIFIVYASLNNEECSKRVCPENTLPKLTDNECLCVTRPK